MLGRRPWGSRRSKQEQPTIVATTQSARAWWCGFNRQSDGDGQLEFDGPDPAVTPHSPPAPSSEEARCTRSERQQSGWAGSARRRRCTLHP
jgi:hypothetical protein